MKTAAELKAEYEVAKVISYEAANAMYAAKKLWLDAASNESGMVGKFYQERGGSKRIIKCTFATETWNGMTPSGPRVLKSGALGENIEFSWRDYMEIPRPENVKD